MADAEIIKAVDCCFRQHSCADCPLDFGENDASCINTLIELIIDLITRQRTEIEKYAETARTVALWLKEFCDMQAPSYLDMIADAARKAGAEIERTKEKNAPVADVVSRGVFDQVKWERDMAIQQLEELGISLGAVAPDVVKVVHCRDCKHKINFQNRIMCDRNARYSTVRSEWYGLTATDNDNFCSYGERKEGQALD